MSLSTAASKIGSTIGKALSSKPARYALTGAGIGGGSYLALTGAGTGISNFNQETGLSDFAQYMTGNGGSGKGVGTLVGIGVLVGIVLLGVFVVIPQFNKVWTRKGTSGSTNSG